VIHIKIYKTKKFREKIRYLDLGCGADKKPSYFGIDVVKLKGVNMVYDLNKGIPFPDNSIEKIYTSHFLEHVKYPLFLLEEIYRVLKKGGTAEITVPHWSWYGSYTFMHKSFFHSLDFDFLDQSHPANYYTKAKFKIISVKLDWGKGNRNIFLRIINALINFILNINLRASENLLVKFLSPKEIRVVLKKI